MPKKTTAVEKKSSKATSKATSKSTSKATKKTSAKTSAKASKQNQTEEPEEEIDEIHDQTDDESTLKGEDIKASADGGKTDEFRDMLVEVSDIDKLDDMDLEDLKELEELEANVEDIQEPIVPSVVSLEVQPGVENTTVTSEQNQPAQNATEPILEVQAATAEQAVQAEGAATLSVGGEVTQPVLEQGGTLEGITSEGGSAPIEAGAGESTIQPAAPPIDDPYPGWGIYPDTQTEVAAQPEFKPAEVSDDLAARIQEELDKKKRAKKIITEDMFKTYCLSHRNKIWYHALWYMVFQVEDHQASKMALYEALRDATSKSAIDPLEEHKFYFGLGFILRLSINDYKLIDFNIDTLKINKNVGIDLLNDILREVGPPISERPVITEDKKKNMFLTFLTDDFKDI